MIICFIHTGLHFATRLSIDRENIERKSAVKILGVWFSEDAGDWSRNTTEICRKAFGKISMLNLPSVY